MSEWSEEKGIDTLSEGYYWFWDKESEKPMILYVSGPVKSLCNESPQCRWIGPLTIPEKPS